MAVKNIAGNAKAKLMMLSYAVEKRGGAAYMLAGEENTGKNYAALQFAKALNCRRPADDSDACDLCENCRALDRTIGGLDSDGMQATPHPDISYVNTEKAQLSIELMRNAMAAAGSYAPVKLKKRIIIVNDAERLNKESSNAILKELEEPRQDTVIMLIVNAPEKMLPTIISRCKKVEIKRASLAEVEAAVKAAGVFSDAEAAEAVLFSDGKIGEALDYKRIKENVETAKEAFFSLASGKDDVDGIFRAIDKLSNVKRASKEEGEEAASEGGKRMFLLDILKILSYIYKDIVLDYLGIKNGLRQKYGINPDSIKRLSLKQAVRIIKLTEAAQRDLMANANVKILLSALFFNIRKAGMEN